MHRPDGAVAARLRLSFPPAAAPARTQLSVGSTVRVAGRFVVDARYGPVQFRVDHTTIVADQSEETAAVEQLVAAIRREGLDTIQQRLTLPEQADSLLVVCPLGRGAGGRDFLDRLAASPHHWNLEVLEVSMGAEDAGPRIARAITVHARQTGAHAVVVCRGGGSPAELAAFNSEPLARAIVEADRPVVVAVGHSHDRHVADLVAFGSCATPSAAAEWFIARRDALARRQLVAAVQHREVTAAQTIHDAERLALRARWALLWAAALVVLLVMVLVIVVVRQIL
jgi:exodeoxyribonuclease VII large subunit